MIKAIETLYKGYRFRSRLEARWAVFFDRLGLTWQYEPEGFELVTGRYLPDFLVEGVWVEVKPTRDSDLSKPRALAAAGKQVVVCIGDPSDKAQLAFLPDHFLPAGRSHANAAWFTNIQKYRPVFWAYSEFDPGDHVDIFVCDEVPLAAISARSARFEHGEQPTL